MHLSVESIFFSLINFQHHQKQKRAGNHDRLVPSEYFSFAIRLHGGRKNPMQEVHQTYEIQGIMPHFREHHRGDVTEFEHIRDWRGRDK